MYAHTHMWRFDGEDSTGARFRCVDCGAETHGEVSL